MDDYLKWLEKNICNMGFDGIINIMIFSGKLIMIEGVRKIFI